MNISFNPIVKNNNFGILKKKKENSSIPKTYTREEIQLAKTKKAISECGVVVLGLGILYFGMKHNLKINRIKAEGRRLREIANTKLPEGIGKKIVDVMPDDFLRI